MLNRGALAVFLSSGIGGSGGGGSTCSLYRFIPDRNKHLTLDAKNLADEETHKLSFDKNDEEGDMQLGLVQAYLASTSGSDKLLTFLSKLVYRKVSAHQKAHGQEAIYHLKEQGEMIPKDQKGQIEGGAPSTTRKIDLSIQDTFDVEIEEGTENNIYKVTLNAMYGNVFVYLIGDKACNSLLRGNINVTAIAGVKFKISKSVSGGVFTTLREGSTPDYYIGSRLGF